MSPEVTLATRLVNNSQCFASNRFIAHSTFRIFIHIHCILTRLGNSQIQLFSHNAVKNFQLTKTATVLESYLISYSTPNSGHTVSILRSSMYLRYSFGLSVCTRKTFCGEIVAIASLRSCGYACPDACIL